MLVSVGAVPFGWVSGLLQSAGDQARHPPPPPMATGVVRQQEIQGEGRTGVAVTIDRPGSSASSNPSAKYVNILPGIIKPCLALHSL